MQQPVSESVPEIASEAPEGKKVRLRLYSLTKHLTTEHYASLVAEVHRLRGLLEAMPLQLYSQFVTLTHVV